MQGIPKGSRRVLSHCAMGEQKHRVKQFDWGHTGRLWKSKVQNLISWESLHCLIHKAILTCWASCSITDLSHCRPLFQQEIHILGFAWTRLKKDVDVGKWITSRFRIWADFDLQRKRAQWRKQVKSEAWKFGKCGLRKYFFIGLSILYSCQNMLLYYLEQISLFVIHPNKYS